MASRLHTIRISWILVILAATLLLLAGRLWIIQINRGAQLSATAAKARLQLIPAEDTFRGGILDRHLVSLTGAEIRPAAVIFPSLIKNVDELINNLTELGFETNMLRSRLNGGGSNRKLAPFIWQVDVADAEKQKLLEEARLPGLKLVPVFTRTTEKVVASHLIGYLGRITKEKWEELSKAGKTASGLQGGSVLYRRDDLVGVKGIESLFEDRLRRGAASSYWAGTVDARGRFVEGLGLQEIVNTVEQLQREHVVLTLDRELQQKVEEIMDQRVSRGAVVVLDIASGDVLAMASRPSFNPRLPVQVLEGQEANLLNRALEYYYPGSVFKTLVAAAALEEGLVTTDEQFVCNGAYIFETGLTIGCWKKEGHGELTFTEALEVSCNPTFVEVGLRLGRERLIRYASLFGLDEPELIGYPLPYKKGAFQIERFGLGKVANASLGQEGVMLTPLMVANIMATVARDGEYVTPRVVREVRRGDGEVVTRFEQAASRRVIEVSTARQVQEMLAGVVKFGTGKEAQVPVWGSAGKTSSAESGSGIHAWFAGYTPVTNPRFAIAVLVEYGGIGGRVAAPVFREIAGFLRERDLR